MKRREFLRKAGTYLAATAAAPMIGRAQRLPAVAQRSLDELSLLDLTQYGLPEVYVNGEVESFPRGDKAIVLVKDRHDSLDGTISTALIYQRLHREAGIKLFCVEGENDTELDYRQPELAEMEKFIPIETLRNLESLEAQCSPTSGLSEDERKKVERRFRTEYTSFFREHKIPFIVAMELMFKGRVRNVMTDDPTLHDEQVKGFNEMFPLMVERSLYDLTHHLTDEEKAQLDQDYNELDRRSEKISLLRSGKQLRNTLKLMKQERHKVVPLRSGSHHIKDIIPMLEGQGIGCYVITPNGMHISDPELADMSFYSVMDID